MKKYALLGYPLKHTLSPYVHGRLFEFSGITDFSYEIMEIPPLKLAGEIKNLNSLCGYNITIPYKCEIIKYTDMLDESARKYGAVNCISNKNGVITGYNTDCLGFTESLKTAGIALSGKVLVLGFGGAGRMMATEAALNGAEVTVAVLDLNEVNGAENISNSLTAVNINEIEGEFDLLVNATPVGMYPEIDGIPVEENIVKHCRAVFDAVYNPSKTKLLRVAEKLGINAVGGMAMLVRQAAAAHEIWYGGKFKDANIDDIINGAYKILNN